MAKIEIVKYVLKVLRVGEYEIFVGKTLAEFRKEMQELDTFMLEGNWDDPAQTDAINRAYEKHSQMRALFYNLTDFMVKEAHDRYADFALFDECEREIPVKKPKTRFEFLVERPDDRLRKYIADEKSAEHLARALAHHGADVKPERAQNIFTYLEKTFPQAFIVLGDEFSKVAPFDNSPTLNVFMGIFDSIGSIAVKEAQKKIGEANVAIKTTDPPEIRATKEEAMKAHEEKVSALAKEKRDHDFDTVFRTLSRTQKGYLVQGLGSTLYIAESSAIAKKFLQHLDNFLDLPHQSLEKLLSSHSFWHTTKLDKSTLRILKKYGFFDTVIRYCLKNPETFDVLIKDGDIEYLGKANAEEVMEKLDIPETYTKILLQNPKLLAEYHCTTPRAMLEKFKTARPDILFFGHVEKFLKYAKQAKSAGVQEEYRLEEHDVLEMAREVIRRDPRTALDNPYDVSNTLGASFLEKLTRDYILNSEDFDLKAIFSYQYARYFKEAIENDMRAKQRVVERLFHDPETAFNQWRDTREFLGNEEQRREFILSHIDSLRSAGYTSLAQIFDDTSLGEDADKQKILDTVSRKSIDFLPELLEAALPEYPRRPSPMRQKLVSEYVTILVHEGKRNQQFIFEHLYNIIRITATLGESGLELRAIIEEHLEEWCKQNPEEIWNNRNELFVLLGKEDFKKFIDDNKFILGRVIMDDFYLREIDTDSATLQKRKEGRDQGFLKKIGKEILDNDPLTLYSSEGNKVLAATLLGIREPRKLFLGTVDSLPLAKFYAKKLRNLATVSENLENEAIDPELVELANHISRLSRSPALPILLRVIESMSRKKTEIFLARIDGMIAAGRGESFAKNNEHETDVGKIVESVNTEIRESFNTLFDLDIKESNSRLLEKPKALLIFAQKYFGDRAMMTLLSAMAQAELRGKFIDWKFFEGDADHNRVLKKLQNEQLLPEKLTITQYEAWAKTEEIVARADLSIDIGEVREANGKIIHDALEHGHVRFEENIFDVEGNAAKLEELEAPLRSIGENIKALRTQEELDEEKLQILEDQRLAYTQASGKELAKQRALFYLGKLLAIGGEEALRGQLKIDENQAHDVPFDRIFRNLRDVFSDSPEFINDLGKISANITEVKKSKDVTVQKLTVTDETDFITAMEIGATPVSSCQHYEHGSLNRSLPAYAADPNTKIFVIKGDRGQLIARSIARLLADKDGNPVLYMEGVYSANPSDEITKLMIDFAYKKAQGLNIPLAVGFASSKFHVNQTVRLENKATRGTHLYTDSGGGLIKEGKFVIPDARVITPNNRS